MPTFIKSLTFSTATLINKLNPNFYLNEPINITEGYCVKSFTGINTVLNIDTRNNRFSFNESDTPGTIRNFTIPSGNYTIATFMTALKTGFDTEGSVVYTVTNNALINIITIAGASKTFKILPIANNSYYEAGFDISGSFSISQVASNTFDLSGIKEINVVCNAFGNSSIVVNRNLNVICTIPVSVPYLGVITYNPPIVFIDSQTQGISAFEFLLFDELYRPLTLTNNWSLNLLFEV